MNSEIGMLKHAYNLQDAISPFDAIGRLQPVEVSEPHLMRYAERVLFGIEYLL